MDEDEEQCRVGLGRYRKKSGETKCQNCARSYNNASVPKYCSCNFLIGGKFQQTLPQLDSKMLTGNLASTRLNVGGPNIRTFVTMGEENKVGIMSLRILAHAKGSPCSHVCARKNPEFTPKCII